jgi:D-alanyl-D-alanine carboxypeptidase/D-alanyl-D-alanine-endopeptidase (penicillin-binding protein 4)
MREKFRITARLCAVGIWLFLSAVTLPAEGGTPSDLSQKVQQAIKTAATKGVEIGILAIRLGDGKEVFSLNPDKILIPASNMKLLTTACALTSLKPEYRFKTVVYGDTPIVGSKVDGNLYLKGFGDPFLVSEEMWRVVRYLHGLGLREVTGNLVADDSFFDNKRWGKGWGNHRSTRWYNAEISALSFNFNTIAFHIVGASRPGEVPLIWTDPPHSSYIRLENKLKTGKKKSAHAERTDAKGKDIFRITGTMPVNSNEKTIYTTIRDATRYTGVSFVDFLKREGIKFNGEVLTGRVPAEAVEIHLKKSKSLAEIVTGLNRFSNNFIAESILKTMGAETHAPPGTAEKGHRVIREFLGKIGVNTEPLVLADGSGLSRQNRLSARALTQVLSYMYGNFEYRPEFIASLATYGVNGTLKKRNGGPARFIRAKTGRIKEVSALSGYIGNGKDVLAFSMLMNNITKNREKIEALQYKICRILAREAFEPK